jgi:hypothetical protein
VQLDVPSELTDDQREAVESLAEAFNGRNPRESLLKQTARPAGKGE